MEKRELTKKCINDYIPDDIIIEIFTYLHGAYILRATTVCRRWKEVLESDYLWLTRLCIEMDDEPEFSIMQNLKINKRLVQKWREEKDKSAKEIYLTTRRNENLPENMRIFPKKKKILDDWSKYS